jgi:hypothetical protein
MKIYKIAKTEVFTEPNGKKFYIHNEEPCHKCGKVKSGSIFTYQKHYLCDECGGTEMMDFSREDYLINDKRRHNVKPHNLPGGGGYKKVDYKPSDTSGSWDDTVNEYETASQNNLMTKIARFDGIYNVILLDNNGPEKIVKQNGVIIEITADSAEQARKFAKNLYPKLREWPDDSWVTRLNKERMLAIENSNRAQEEMKRQKEERAQGIYD